MSTVTGTGSVVSQQQPAGVPPELVEALMARVKAEGLELLGENGVL